MDFPQFRCYTNSLSYFKILNTEEFLEYKLAPDQKLEKYHFKAQILPDRNYIQDLLDADEQYWLKIKEDDFLDFLQKHGSA